LIKHDADSDHVDHNGQTPIYYSMKSGKEACLRFFIDQRANVNRIDGKGVKLI
jgi:hypothetical protein